MALSPQAIAEKGEKIYKEKYRDEFERIYQGKFVAIEIDTEKAYVGDVVPLDTHLLKWLRAQGYDAPKSTPPAGPKYAALEEAFVREAHLRNVSVRELDTQVWKQYARK